MNTFNKRSLIIRPDLMKDPIGSRHLVGLALCLFGLTSWMILPCPASSRPSQSSFAHRTNPTTKLGQLGSGVDSTSSASGQIAPLGLNAWSSNGPEGAFITSLAMDPTNPATVYAGTYGSGVFKSTNSGTTWSAAGLDDGFVLALAIDPTSPNIIYGGGWYGVFKSTNGGASWTFKGLANSNVYALAIDPSNPNIIYEDGSDDPDYFVPMLNKSTDGGESWNQVLSAAHRPLLAIDSNNPTNIYTGALDGILKSTDGGGSWNFFNQGLPIGSYVGSLAIDPSNPNTIYAETSGVFKSTSGGATWNSVGPTIAALALAVDPSNPNTVYAGTAGSGVFKSTDAGANWSAFNAGLTNLRVNALAIDSSGAQLHAGTAAGVFDYQYYVGCADLISPTSRSHGSGPETGSIGISAPPGCSWTATTGATWITITSGAAGTGNGTVNYSVNPNLTVNSRTGTLNVDGQTFTVSQAGIAAVGISYFESDFDSDGKTEIGYYRAGLWAWLKSTQSFSFGSAQFFSWGEAGLQPICDDFDGDGKADIAHVVPPSGGQSAAYAILKSSTGYDFGQALFVSAGFPSLGDTPVVGDFDGDGKADPGIWRASQGVWMIPLSSSNYSSFIFAQWGQLGDVPVVADFDGDSRADIGFYRNGLWGVLKSTQSYGFGSAQFVSWGGAGLQPIVADFDGDGKADIAHIVPMGGGQSAAYAILKSGTGYDFGQALFMPAGFPSIGDTPVVGDYDGDGKADPGIWRESQGVWIVPISSTGYASYIFTRWGQSGDIALPNTTGKH